MGSLIPLDGNQRPIYILDANGNPGQLHLDASGFLEVAAEVIATIASLNLTEVGGQPIALGQTTMSASLPVAFASNQSALPVTGTFFQAVQPVSGTVTVLQGTTPWSISGSVTANAGTNLNTSLLALESGGNLAAILAKLNASIAVTGTFWQTTQPVSIADGSDTTLGSKTDARNAATDGTSISAMQVFKEISYMLQNPASLAAGSNLIGKVSIDQTTAGTTNNVEITGHTGANIKDDTQFGDGVTTGILSVHNRLWNGASYDRWHGDTTNGAWVNLKSAVTISAAQSGTWNIGTLTTITNAVNTNADTTIGGTSAPSKLFLVGGKSNDGTPQYQPIPLAASGASVIVSGSITSSGTVTANQGTAAAASSRWPVFLTDGTNAQTFNSTTTTSKFGADVNILSILGTAPTTAGKLDVIGTKTNNNAAPGGTNIGALIALANASAPSWSEGDMVTASVDLSGNQRVRVRNASIYFANAIKGVVTVASSVAGALVNDDLINTDSAPIYIQCFDVASGTSVTLGTTAPTFVIPIPAASTAANGVASRGERSHGYGFANGLKVAATTTSTGSTTSTNGATGTIGYTSA